VEAGGWRRDSVGRRRRRREGVRVIEPKCRAAGDGEGEVGGEAEGEERESGRARERERIMAGEEKCIFFLTPVSQSSVGARCVGRWRWGKGVQQGGAGLPCVMEYPVHGLGSIGGRWLCSPRVVLVPQRVLVRGGDVGAGGEVGQARHDPRAVLVQEVQLRREEVRGGSRQEGRGGGAGRKQRQMEQGLGLVHCGHGVR